MFVGGLFHLDRLGDLAVLEFDGWVVHVSVGMVFGQNLQGLVGLVGGDEEARRLGDPWSPCQ